jgi:hypothetical protein
MGKNLKEELMDSPLNDDSDNLDFLLDDDGEFISLHFLRLLKK